MLPHPLSSSGFQWQYPATLSSHKADEDHKLHVPQPMLGANISSQQSVRCRATSVSENQGTPHTEDADFSDLDQASLTDICTT